MWKSDESALPAITWLPKQPKLSSVPFVLSKWVCCNSHLSGCPLYLLSRLQKVQNSAVKLVQFQSPQTWSCAASSSVNLFVGKTVNYLSQLLLCLIFCLSLWLSRCVHPLLGNFVLPLQAHGYLVSPTLKLKQSANALSLHCGERGMQFGSINDVTFIYTNQELCQSALETTQANKIFITWKWD